MMILCACKNYIVMVIVNPLYPYESESFVGSCGPATCPWWIKLPWGALKSRPHLCLHEQVTDVHVVFCSTMIRICDAEMGVQSINNPKRGHSFGMKNSVVHPVENSTRPSSADESLMFGDDRPSTSGECPGNFTMNAYSSVLK